MEKAKNIMLAVLTVLLACSFFYNVHLLNAGRMSYRDTVRTVLIDTIPYYRPVPKDSTVVRYITEVLPVVPDSCDNSGENIPDTCGNEGFFVSDSVKVSIPITSKMYEDSTYRAYVSGYRANLDSIFIFPKREAIMITKQEKCKCWGIGVQVGCGFTLDAKPQFSPYIGVGVSYNLFNF